MHPVTTMKDWGHHLHDGMATLWHEINQHLHSRHFWTGVGITLLVIGLVAMAFILVKNSPILLQDQYQYGFPHSHYRF